jgi:class 3 adenylate cyclase
VLVDERTTELLGSADIRAALRRCAPLNLKGFRDPVANYALASA